MNKQKAEVYVTGNFYYDCGQYFGYYPGDVSTKFKHTTINRFKTFVEEKGGPEKFIGPDSAVKEYLKTNKGKRNE